MKYRTSQCVVFCIVFLWVATLSASFVAVAQGPNRQGLYVPPVNSFIHDPAETPIALEFGSASLASIQQQLDAARAAAPATSPIVLTLTGNYIVTDTPLKLPSRTSLVLYGTIRAGLNATATSLISITGQSEVAVAGGLLDGRRKDLSGIEVETSGKINIDAVTITNTGRDGIVLRGNGNTVFNSGSAITRCEVTEAGGNGIRIGSITQALVLDNFVHDNKGAGIQVSSAHSSIVNNVSQGNSAGVVVDSNDNLISDNELRDNRNEGIRLDGSSANTAVLRNIMADNGVLGIDLNGNNNLIYGNTLHNPTDLTDRVAGNWVVQKFTPLQAPLSQYFYPPTINNRHSERVMNGRERTDLVIDSGSSPTISMVQTAYDEARRQHPDDVIVLKLTGNFTVDGSPLLLQSWTALILDGAINVPSNSTVEQAITATNPAEFVSISGGTIDLGGRSMEGIFFPSARMAYVTQVAVKRGGDRDVRAGKGMIHFQRGGGYNIVQGSLVDNSGGRCIWTQNANSRYVVLENYLTNCNQDGVDFDSSTANSLAIGNMNIDNRRYGVFIEQSDSLNKIYGNVATTRGIPDIPGRAIGIYNNATAAGVRGITDRNTIFSNVSDVIADGLRIGSISTATGGVAETARSFLFNNIVRNSRGNGILVDTQFPRSIENYASQTVLSGNGKDLESHPSNGGAPLDFFNPPSAINLALRHPVTASSSEPGSTAEAAVDGLGYTNWAPAAGKFESRLTIDLGADARFGRVMIKQTTADFRYLFNLQVSNDGVNFTNLPSNITQIVISGAVNSVSFTPVTARFLRVQIFKLPGVEVGFEEISVHPK